MERCRRSLSLTLSPCLPVSPWYTSPAPYTAIGVRPYTLYAQTYPISYSKCIYCPATLYYSELLHVRVRIVRYWLKLDYWLNIIT